MSYRARTIAAFSWAAGFGWVDMAVSSGSLGVLARHSVAATPKIRPPSQNGLDREATPIASSREPWPSRPRDSPSPPHFSAARPRSESLSAPSRTRAPTLTNAMSSAAFTTTPGDSRTAAWTASPHLSSATPNTLHSATAGCLASTASTSPGKILKPAAVDHLAKTAADVHVAAIVDEAEIAGVEPAIHDRLRRHVGSVEVAAHHERPAHDDLADLAVRQRARRPDS